MKRFESVRLRNDGQEYVFSPDQLPIVIGRCVGDVLVNDRFASRVHSELCLTGDGLLVRDLNSRHGTRVNGIPVIEKILQQGDLLQVGLTTFEIVEIPSEELIRTHPDR